MTCGFRGSKVVRVIYICPSHFSTSYALENETTNALHDASVSLKEANYYTSSDSINSHANTSDSDSENESMDNDNVNAMNIDLMKYPHARLFGPKGYFTLIRHVMN